MHHPAHGSQKEESRCRRCGGMNLIDNHPEHPCSIPPFKEPISFPVFPHPAMPSCLHSGYFLSSHFCILLFCRSNDFLYLCCVKIGISAWQKPQLRTSFSVAFALASHYLRKWLLVPLSRRHCRWKCPPRDASVKDRGTARADSPACNILAGGGHTTMGQEAAIQGKRLSCALFLTLRNFATFR